MWGLFQIKRFPILGITVKIKGHSDIIRNSSFPDIMMTICQGLEISNTFLIVVYTLWPGDFKNRTQQQQKASPQEDLIHSIHKSRRMLSLTF